MFLLEESTPAEREDWPGRRILLLEQNLPTLADIEQNLDWHKRRAKSNRIKNAKNIRNFEIERGRLHEQFAALRTELAELQKQTHLLKQQNNQLRRELIACRVCYRADPLHVNKCGHVICAKCWGQVTRCPFCQTPKSLLTRVFI